VGVPQNHLHRLVPRQLLHGDDVRPGHRQSAGECAAGRGTEILDAGPSARRFERVQQVRSGSLPIREDKGVSILGGAPAESPGGAVDGDLPPVAVLGPVQQDEAVLMSMSSPTPATGSPPPHPPC
jgi:hypothetical protein